jgi:flagellar basal-body rod modification protein FlgD
MSAVSSASLLGMKSFEDINKERQPTREDMGRQEFLTLFTAQLQNQNPLEPVKNEAFVAQLAQFSQLEALTNMQGSLESFVTTMSSDRILNSSTLVGKKVAVEGAFGYVDEFAGLEGKIDLPQGASSVQVSVFDSSGRQVADLSGGPQLPGTWPLYWDGTDSFGNAAPTGNYRMTVSAVVGGQPQNIPVNIMSTVRAVTSGADGSISLQVDGGKTVKLSDVKHVGL